MSLKSSVLICYLCLLSPIAYADGLDGSRLSLNWIIPFGAILLSIALMPILFKSLWHNHYGKIIFGWTLVFIGLFNWQFGLSSTMQLVCHAILTEYIPFMILLLALFTISGGILIDSNIKGTPINNTLLLLVGTLLASIMGTTGSAMLMIRPLIRANEQRQYRVHIIIFFIFLVANIGGGLTPLGDPPLFIGFLKGVDFIWTLQQMGLPVLLNTTLLLTSFYIIDRYYYRKELQPYLNNNTESLVLNIEGKYNFILLILVILTVLMTAIWETNISIEFLYTTISLSNLIRDLSLIILIILSLSITTKSLRTRNQFHWHPMIEVAKLFIGIFITITPVIAILKAGNEGELSDMISVVTNSSGEPINNMYFWLSGLLSGFLDNAPTYLVFFNLASGDANILMSNLPTTLLAISMGSVFMGALTYIGNAPNIMVKSIANQSNINMPSFFGYMRWSISLLIPLFIIDSLVFIRL